MSIVKKAIVAVAGSGTRFLPATKTMPKEMLPVVDKPIIQIVVEELVAGGVEDIILVTKWDKKPLEDHFDQNLALESELEKANKIKQRDEIRKIADMANFVYVRQKGPYGNGTPVLSAKSLVGDEPFIYAWGDDLVHSAVPFTKQLVEDYSNHGNPLIGVQSVPKEDVSKYGIVKLTEGSRVIEDIVEKPSAEETPSQLADFGRMILNRKIVDILDNTKLGKGGELWIVDALRTYIKNGGILMAKEIEDGEWLTTGDPENYLRTVLKYALARPDYGAYVRVLMQELLGSKHG